MTAKRPPGRSTRNASRRTAGLSADRLITQLRDHRRRPSRREAGSSSIVALEELDVLGARLALVLAREREHLVGHVEAVGLAARADAARREQHVDAAAGAEIEHGLALGSSATAVGLPQPSDASAASSGTASLAVVVERAEAQLRVQPRPAAAAASPPPPPSRPRRSARGPPRGSSSSSVTRVSHALSSSSASGLT